MPAKKLGVKELRANLADHLESEDAVLIRNHRRVVAVLLPTGIKCWWRDEEKKAALSRMKIMLEQDVREAILHL